jgi:transcriptional regulator with XRE-family HTH domain
MKRIIVKEWETTTLLGKATFKRVPIYVSDDFTAEGSGPVELPAHFDAGGPDGVIIKIMAREVAKQWRNEFVHLERQIESITPEEIYGMMLVMDLNATELSSLLGIGKGMVSKILNGKQPANRPLLRLLLLVFSADLTRPGSAKEFAATASFPSDITIRESKLEPNFEIDRAA